MLLKYRAVSFILKFFLRIIHLLLYTVRCCSWNLALTVPRQFPSHEMEDKISHLFETGFNFTRPNILVGKCLRRTR
jgi:hypothetical protein